MGMNFEQIVNLGNNMKDTVKGNRYATNSILVVPFLASIGYNVYTDSDVSGLGESEVYWKISDKVIFLVEAYEEIDEKSSLKLVNESNIVNNSTENIIVVTDGICVHAYIKDEEKIKSVYRIKIDDNNIEEKIALIRRENIDLDKFKKLLIECEDKYKSMNILRNKLINLGIENNEIESIVNEINNSLDAEISEKLNSQSDSNNKNTITSNNMDNNELNELRESVKSYSDVNEEYRLEIVRLHNVIVERESEIEKLKEENISIQNKLDNTPAELEQKALKILDEIEDDGSNETLYAVVLNGTIIKRDSAEKLMGDIFTELTAVDKFKSLEFIFNNSNNEIYKITQNKGVSGESNDAIISGKAYTIKINKHFDMYEIMDRIKNNLISYFDNLQFAYRIVKEKKEEDTQMSYGSSDDIDISIESAEVIETESTEINEDTNELNVETSDIKASIEEEGDITNTFNADTNNDVFNSNEYELSDNNEDNLVEDDNSNEYAFENDEVNEEAVDESGYEFSEEEDSSNIEESEEYEFNEDIDESIENSDEAIHDSVFKEEEIIDNGLSEDEELGLYPITDENKDTYTDFIVCQLSDIGCVVWDNDNIDVTEIKYIGTNDENYYITNADDIDYNDISEKLIEAIINIEYRRGNKEIIDKLKRTNLSEVSSSLSLKSETNGSQIPLTRFVVYNIENLKQSLDMISRICNSLDIACDGIFVYMNIQVTGNNGLKDYEFNESEVNIVDNVNYVRSDDTVDEVLGKRVILGNMLSYISITKNSIGEHRMIFKGIDAVKTKYTERRIQSYDDFIDTVVDIISNSIEINNNSLDIDEIKQIKMLDSTYSLVSDDVSDCSLSYDKIYIGDISLYLSKVSEFQQLHMLIMLHIKLHRTSSIAISAIVSEDAINFYEKHFFTGEPSLSLANNSLIKLLQSKR